METTTESASPPSTSAASTCSFDAERIAEDLLSPLWRGLATEFKTRYARNIWDQFEHQVRSAAYTSRLEYFLQRITSRLPIHIQSDDLQRVSVIIGSGADRDVLKLLRDETAYAVLLVRLANEERRAALAGGAA